MTTTETEWRGWRFGCDETKAFCQNGEWLEVVNNIDAVYFFEADYAERDAMREAAWAVWQGLA